MNKERIEIRKVAEFDLEKGNIIAYDEKITKQIRKGVEAMEREFGIKWWWTKK